jgi:hypothetical protein
MDAQSIDVQIRSLSPPGTQPLDPADALPLAMRANDIAADAVRRHPRGSGRSRSFPPWPTRGAPPSSNARRPRLRRSNGLRATLLRHALEVTTPDRLLFSTDYPFQRPSKADIDRFGTAFPTDEDRERFMAGNARALFAITS